MSNSSIFDLCGEIMLLVLGCCFWEIYLFLRTCLFSLISAEPLYQNVSIDHRIIFDFFYKNTNIILWPIRTFWYKGSAEIKENKHVRKKAYIWQKQQPEIKSVSFQKSLAMVSKS